MTRTSWRVLPAAALVCTLLLIGPEPVAEAGADRALVVLEQDEPQTTYPFHARMISESRLAELMFDRLFVLSSGGDVYSRVFEPGWTSKSPNLGVTVRSDLKFANGTQATFSDVTFTLNDVYRRSDVGHDLGPWYSKVFGDAQQITPMVGKVRFGVPMPDDGAERYLLTSVLLSREALGATGKPEVDATKRQPMGTGPFWAAEPIESFDDILLVRNEHRANPTSADQLPIKSIRLQYDQDAARQRELMEGGRADVWVSPPPAVLPPFLNQSKRYGSRAYDLNQWWFVAVNHGNRHLADPRVREALDLAMPRGQLVEKFGGESARLTSGPFLPGSAWEPGDAKPTAEARSQAKKLMEEAGFTMVGGKWAKGGDGVSLRFGVVDEINDDYNDVVYGITDAWEEAGFNVKSRTIRNSDWRDSVEAGKAAETYDLILGRWNIDREEGALELFSKTRKGQRVVNLFGYESEPVEEMTRSYYQETSGPKREATMQRLHRHLHDDRPYLFLWTLQVKSVYRKDRISGFRISPFYYFTDVERLSWKADAPD